MQVPIDSVEFTNRDRKVTQGQGFDTITGKLKGFVVHAAPLMPNPDHAEGTRKIYDVNIAESFFEVSQQLSASASASFTSLVGGASAYAELFKTRKENKYSLYVTACVKVHNAPVGMEEYKLTDPAREDASRMTTEHFFNKYGDTFVSGLVTGGQLVAVIEIFNKSAVEREDTKAAAQVHVGSFSASAEFAKSIEQITATKSTHVQVLKNGGLEDIPDLDGLVLAAHKFSDEVVKRPVLYSVVIDELEETEDWPDDKTPPSTSLARRALETLQKARLRAESMKLEVELIREMPELFESHKQNLLDEAEGEINRAIEAIDDAAGKVIDDPLGPPPAEHSLVPAVHLPKLILPPVVPVRVSVRSASNERADATRVESTSGDPAGRMNAWIENLLLEKHQPLPGLGIAYDAEFSHIFDHPNRNVGFPISGHDGQPIGRDAGGDIFALRSIRINLTGPKREFYDVVYKAVYQSIEGGGADHPQTTPECRNGDLAQATGTADRTVAVGKLLPSSFITEISVQIVRKAARSSVA